MTTQRLGILLVWMIGVYGGSAFGQRQEGLFSLGRDRIVRAVITTTIELPDLPVVPKGRGLPAMVLEASGVLDIVEGRRLSDVRALAPRGAKPIGRPPDARSICFIHLIGSKTSKVVEVVATDDGLVVGEHAGTGLSRPARAELNRVRWEKLRAGLSLYRGSYEGTADEIAKPFEMPTPYVHGAFTLDFDTIEERFYHGQRLREAYRLDRVLGEDAIHVRLPVGYDPSEPSGLLVWVSPTPRGAIPVQFYPVLDELNLIAVGANNSGNGRVVYSRYQLALDGVATASERYHIDPERVYLTGMSGGGRITSMLGACFPDVFAGTIPIVGMNIYEVTSRGDGAKWNRGYYKPPVKLFRILRTRRFAPMSGPPDGNYLSMRAAARVLERDRVPVRFFDYEDMGHEMPTAARFTDAMRWVDEPYREAREEMWVKAEELLDLYAGQFGVGGVGGDGDEGAGDPESDEAIGLLLDVIEAGPWSAAAWSALELLGR